ncbi:hypothetical protein VTI74DRAFT_8703 [Chaetomium olivicolor]
MTTDASISPDKILALASAIRKDGTSPTFSFGTNTKPFDAGECQVYAVAFPDDVTWAVRVPAQAGKCLTPTALAFFVDAQAKMLAKLDDAGFRWSPKLIYHDTSFHNLIGHPYLVVSWFPGTALEWTDTVPSKPADREKILRQVVDIQLDLVERAKDLRHDASTLSFLTGIVDGKIVRAATDKEPPFNVRDCFVHRALVRHAVDPSLGSDPSIFSVSHESLAAHSIIVDQEYNITGTVDWMFARTLPLQLAFRLPRFLAIEPDAPNETASQVPSDIPAFATQFLQPSPSLVTDRQFTRFYLSSIISDSNEPERALLAQTMKTIHSDPDSNWRYLIIEACFSKGLHNWLAKRLWLLHGTKGKMADLASLPAEVTEGEEDSFLKSTGMKEGFTRDSLLETIKSQ